MRKKYLGLVRLLVVLAATALGVLQGFAQTKASQSKPATPGGQKSSSAVGNKVWIKDPNRVMPMRKMTNAERQAAAERNKARQSVFQGRTQQGPKGTQTGVQQ